jgi:anti-sigma factor (TIGR02949 family)
MNCDHASPLISPYLDGELTREQELALERHVDGCPLCSAELAETHELSRAIQSRTTRHAAPTGLRQRVVAAIATDMLASRRRRPETRGWMRLAATLLVGAVLGAGTTWQLGGTRPDLAEEVVSGHIRSLMPGHLTDVVSTDQHTVKPWFNGRVDLAPPVQDFADRGFPLVGGRLDYIGGRPVAALVYRHREHVINVFVTPAKDGAAGVETSSHQGYNLIRWREGGVELWAVSDLNSGELREFETLLSAAPR